MYFQFISFLHTDMTQVVEIFSHESSRSNFIPNGIQTMKDSKQHQQYKN